MNFVTIRPVDKNTVNVSYQFDTLIKENSGGCSCFIPGFRIYFACKNQEGVEIKAKAMASMYLNYFFNDSKNGLKNFTLQLNKLGYKADNHNITVKSLINNKALLAKFKPSNSFIPSDFADAKSVAMEQELSMAV